MILQMKKTEETKMFGMTKTLIVVYKDEMLVNQLKKMVETNDDNEGRKIIGTRDGSINIVSWSEKVWIANKKAGNIKDKVLFLGDIKGTDKLIPVIDVKFDDFGVKFGWAGNQAAVFVDIKAVSGREDYLAFIDKLSDLHVPDIVKNPKNVKLSVTAADVSIEDEQAEISETIMVDDTKQKKSQVFFDRAKTTLVKGIDTVGKASMKVAAKTEDLLRDRSAVTRQMLFYGIVNMYNDGLEEFMNL